MALFLVRMDVSIPYDLDPDVAADTIAREKEYSQDLQRRGVWRNIWRVAGSTRTTRCSRSRMPTSFMRSCGTSPCSATCPAVSLHWRIILRTSRLGYPGRRTNDG